MPPRTEGRLEHREERFLDKEGEGTKKGQAGKEKGRDKREGEIKKRVRLWRGVCVCVCMCGRDNLQHPALRQKSGLWVDSLPNFRSWSLVAKLRGY